MPKSKAATKAASPPPPKAPHRKGLTDRERAFVEFYLVSWNATDAARRANYSPKTARQIGSENLSKPYIREAIAARITELKMSADEVLTRLAEQARANIGDYITDEGTIDVKAARQANKLHLVKTFASTKQGERIELYDAQAALEKIGRAHRLFSEHEEDDSAREIHIHVGPSVWTPNGPIEKVKPTPSVTPRK